MKTLLENKIAIIGLGYVGLPLAVEFSKKYTVVGFDIDSSRVEELKQGIDKTKEVPEKELSKSKEHLIFSNNRLDLESCDVYIITVPTPINKDKLPDLRPLITASKLVGEVISKGNIVIYDSTVYPGATEEDCIPVVEKVSGLKYNRDFFVGYSPERINPGDRNRKIGSIIKVTSGSTPKVATFVDDLYASIIKAGTFKVNSIKVAEASKVVENVQRDVNISLINEFHQIFTRLGISTTEVIEAAATKWNFMKIKPGLVGGHCIGVDPYYLLDKSQKSGYVPDLIRTAREINDSMAEFVVQEFVSHLIKRKVNPVDLKVLILGFSFKENCPDFRNTKVIDVYNVMRNYGFEVTIYDPVVDKEAVWNEYAIELTEESNGEADVAFLAVKHEKILQQIRNRKFNLCYSEVYDYRR